MLNFTCFRVFIIAGLSALYALDPNPCLADANLYDQTKTDSVLGQNTGADYQSGVADSSSTVESKLEMFVVGAAFQALSAMSNPPNTIDGVTYNEVYSFGKRVFSNSFYFQSSANGLGFSAGLAPTEVRVPLLVYPIGGVILELDGGARFQAMVNGQNMSVIGIPASLSSLGIELDTNASGAGFIEGYAKFLIIRAGVGGQLDLVDAQANVNARVTFDNNPPLVMISAMVQFLKGQFYAFLDYYNIFKFGWTRLLNYNLYSWNGYCFATGALTCPGN